MREDDAVPPQLGERGEDVVVLGRADDVSAQGVDGDEDDHGVRRQRRGRRRRDRRLARSVEQPLRGRGSGRRVQRRTALSQRRRQHPRRDGARLPEELASHGVRGSARRLPARPRIDRDRCEGDAPGRAACEAVCHVDHELAERGAARSVAPKATSLWIPRVVVAQRSEMVSDEEQRCEQGGCEAAPGDARHRGGDGRRLPR